jgi:Flp pilus assembly protein TadG
MLFSQPVDFLRNAPYRFARCTRGAFFILAALVLVVVLGIVGLAIDTARGYIARNNMQVAADLAVLAAGTTYRTVFDASGGTDPAAALTAAQDSAQRFFLANLRPNLQTGSTPPLTNMQFLQLPGGDLQVTYNGRVGLSFGRTATETTEFAPSVIARVSLTPAGATRRLPVELVFVLDGSYSMNLCSPTTVPLLPSSECQTAGGRVVSGLSTAAALRQSMNAGIETLFENTSTQPLVSAKTIMYSDDVYYSGLFTSNKAALKGQLDSYVLDENTNILSPVQQAAAELARFTGSDAAAPKTIEVMIVMSDGRHNIAPPLENPNPNLSTAPVVAACQSFIAGASANVQREIFTVYFNNEDNYSSGQQALQLLRDCASKSQYAFTAENTGELNSAYQQIMNEVLTISTTLGKPQLTL